MPRNRLHVKDQRYPSSEVSFFFFFYLVHFFLCFCSLGKVYQSITVILERNCNGEQTDIRSEI